MSDLDKAIRAAADEANWFGLHNALTAVLNELNGWDRDAPVFADRLRRVIAEPLGVSDRSKPTPVPREPRVWQEGDPDPAEEGLVIRDADGDEAAYRNGHWDWTVIDGEQVERRPWSWPAGDMAYPATEVLSEVVSPEGTP